MGRSGPLCEYPFIALIIIAANIFITTLLFPTVEDKSCVVVQISVYPITTSSAIINTKPIAKPMVLRLLCSPLEASGISSSTTT